MLRTFWVCRQLRSIYFTFKLVPKPEPIDVSVIKPDNYWFWKLNFQSNTIWYYDLIFFFLFHMQMDFRYLKIHSFFFLLCRILFFYFLEWSQFTFDFIHQNVAPCHNVTIFISPLFYFTETNIVVSLSISSCCFINSFSLLLVKILLFSFFLPLDKILSFLITANSQGTGVF